MDSLLGWLLLGLPVAISGALMAVRGYVTARSGPWRLRTLAAKGTIASICLSWGFVAVAGGHGFGSGPIPVYLLGVLLLIDGSRTPFIFGVHNLLLWLALASFLTGLIAFAGSIRAVSPRSTGVFRAWPWWVDSVVLIAAWIAPFGAIALR